MLNTVKSLLTRGSTLLVPRTDDNLLPPVVVVQLMLRGLKTLSKSLSSMTPSAHFLRLQTQFDDLIQKLIFTTTSSSLSGASTLSPCVEFLLSMSTLPSLPPQTREYILCNSRQATDAVRRLILLGLDLAERSGSLRFLVLWTYRMPSNDCHSFLSFECTRALFHSIYPIILKS